MSVRQKFASFFDTITFGEHKDKIFVDVLDDSPDYIQWCMENDVIEVSKEMTQRVERTLEGGRR